MTNPNANEPAYPVLYITWQPQLGAYDTHLHPGLTKREEFAKAAMQGILSSSHVSETPSPEYVRDQAYKYADAMLAKPKEGK